MRLAVLKIPRTQISLFTREVDRSRGVRIVAKSGGQQDGLAKIGGAVNASQRRFERHTRSTGLADGDGQKPLRWRVQKPAPCGADRFAAGFVEVLQSQARAEVYAVTAVTAARPFWCQAACLG
jgi:hypothetical protein